MNLFKKRELKGGIVPISNEPIETKIIRHLIIKSGDIVTSYINNNYLYIITNYFKSSFYICGINEFLKILNECIKKFEMICIEYEYIVSVGQSVSISIEKIISISEFETNKHGGDIKD